MPTRQEVIDNLERFIALHSTDYKNVSEDIGKNHSYIQQFITRGTPKQLSEDVRQSLADLFGTTEDQFKIGATSIRVSKKSSSQKVHKAVAANTGVAQIAEIDVTGGVGGGGVPVHEQNTEIEGEPGHAINTDEVLGYWSVPEDYARSELKIDPGGSRIIRITGDSMEPKLYDGDRVLVDTNDRNPSPPGVFALWDNYGVVVKSVERVHGTDPARLRLISLNTTYSPYEVVEGEAHLIGRVKWVARAF